MESTTPSTDPSPSSNSSRGRGRGRARGKSRGGLGKYLRARGIRSGGGRGGRPAEFRPRLLLEDEQEVELDEEELQEWKAREEKYARRELGTNADRYVEREPELDEDGEPIVEPEVDLSAFLERQRLALAPPASSAPSSTHSSSSALPSSTLPSSSLHPETLYPSSHPLDADDEVDTALASHLASLRTTKGKATNVGANANERKGRVQQVEWDASLEALSREKAAADAARDLKARFKEKTARDRARAPPLSGHPAHSARTLRDKGDKARTLVQAPALPTPTDAPPKTEKEGLEDFLDDLLG